jgi:alpha-N-acetylglucosamine transferase
MADNDEQKVLADARKLPYSERVAHKNWKVRSEAYESIASTCSRAFSENDECFYEFGTSLL